MAERPLCCGDRHASANRCALPGNSGKPNNDEINVFGSRYTCKSTHWKGHKDAACRTGVSCLPGHACIGQKCRRQRRGG